ncbi:hypothetical protein Lfu02_13130 [Longispora fulva]|uniref:Collagen-like protein n=1 Tax=Longispora fulva TaxID=619741 RepID=A0A8J7GE42_9ACTN|nr:hypothetical protein [Longispora fulva]MBG6134827.1 hypothetical protein [Longispora fulva]GIG56941.1 hypothetical protein Lfu02_13130 [Longispora fulva]
MRTHFAVSVALAAGLAGALVPGAPGLAAPPVVRACPGSGAGTMSSGSSVSASSVAALHGDVSSVMPPVVDTPPAPMTARDYLKPISALGELGPLGPWGPLSANGPLPGAAARLAPPLGAVDPLGPDGPLGAQGPLGVTAYCQTLPSTGGDYGRQLQLGGLWTVLGPMGPLGAMGPLGPLGPTGPLAGSRNAHGEYVDAGGRVRRTVAVPWPGGPDHVYGLVEDYPAGYALTLPGNDTSFTVRHTLPVGGSEAYPFASDTDQFVTVLVVPEKGFASLTWMTDCVFGTLTPARVHQLDTYEDVSYVCWFLPQVLPAAGALTDRFDLALTDGNGAPLASATSQTTPNWAQVRVPAGQSLRARVTARSSLSGPGDYRLVVVGSGPSFNATDIAGAHQVRQQPTTK